MLKIIKYKNVVHLFNYYLRTDCCIDVPSRGNHLKTQREIIIDDLEKIVTCKNCSDTLMKGGQKFE